MIIKSTYGMMLKNMKIPKSNYECTYVAIHFELDVNFDVHTEYWRNASERFLGLSEEKEIVEEDPNELLVVFHLQSQIQLIQNR